jgi:hypothetical protein
MELTVRTVSLVPAGIVAAFKDEAANQAQIMAITAMNLSRIILVERVELCAEEKSFQS